MHLFPGDTLVSELNRIGLWTKGAEIVNVRGKWEPGQLDMTQQKTHYGLIKKVKVSKITKLPIPLASE